MASSALKHVSHPSPVLDPFLLILRQAIASTTLQQAQTDTLLALLNLGSSQDAPAPSTTSTQPKSAQPVKPPTSTAPLVWKVLVLDQQTKDVLATVLRVQDLRDAGVTLHVYAISSRVTSWSSYHHSQLHSLRPPLPDVPAVYFVAPTLANIRRISEDLDKCLYESFHLNFVEPLPRALLEELAASVAASGTGELVEQVGLLTVPCLGKYNLIGSLHQVVDQYLSFIAPSPSLFSLLSPLSSPVSQAGPSQPKPYYSYKLLNSPSSTEQQIEDEIERVASGIFSAVVTAGTCSQGLPNIELSLIDPQDMSQSSELQRAMQQKWSQKNSMSRSEMRYFPPHALMGRPRRSSHRIPLDCPICNGHVRFFVLRLFFIVLINRIECCSSWTGMWTSFP